MRVRHAIVLAALAAGAAGCLPVPSLYPLVPEKDGIEVPEIAGDWGDAKDHIRFEPGRNGLYTLSDPDTTDPMGRFHVRFARFGGRLFADVTSDTQSLSEGDPGPWLWRMHVFFRVDVAGDSLRLAFLDDEWVDDALDHRRIRLRHEHPEDGIVLTESTAGLQALARRLANVDAAFDSSASFMHRR